MGQPLTDITISILVLSSSILYAIGTVQLAPHWKHALVRCEDCIQVFFLVEYVLRWYSRNCRLTYLVKWEMIVDALAFLPLVIHTVLMRFFGLNVLDHLSLQFLRLLRIARAII